VECIRREADWSPGMVNLSRALADNVFAMVRPGERSIVSSSRWPVVRARDDQVAQG